MSDWTDEELRVLDRVGEIQVAGRRNNGSMRSPVTVWHVVVDGKLYIRSVRGTDGGWYKGVIRHHEGTISWDEHTRQATYIPDNTANDAIDRAYFTKYGSGAASQAITNPTAKATTLRVEPR